MGCCLSQDSFPVSQVHLHKGTRQGGLNLGDEIPDFTTNSTEGIINFHEWLGGSWAILFSHPADFTPVCTTELGRVMQLHEDFRKRGVKVIALSCNSIADHKTWTQDILAYINATDDLPYPILEDTDRKLATRLGMVDPIEHDQLGMPMTCRAVFIIGPDKKLRLSLLYPATTGRNFNEILRVVDSLQLTDRVKVATPVDWKPGDRCLIVPALNDDEAQSIFPNLELLSLPSRKNYLRYTLDY